MRIAAYDPELLYELVKRFEANNLVYGIGTRYASLVTPTSTVLTSQEAREISIDLAQAWALYRTWNELYLSALRGEGPDWIRELTEHGLPPGKIAAHRMIAEARLEPRMCRLDYTALSTRRKIAEVQWKSGGLGLFFGLQDVYERLVGDLADSVPPLGTLPEQFARVAAVGDDSVAVNAVATDWFKSEHYLAQLLRDYDIQYVPLRRDDCDRRILDWNDRYYVSEGPRLRRIDFLYGREFGEIFRSGSQRLARAVLDGRVWVETPLNFAYRQKWGLALPFMNEFSGLFDDRLREVLIPTALLKATDTDLSPIVSYVENRDRERLIRVKQPEDLDDLPTALRKSLVIKCGAGRGDFHSHGKGVFRIGGSKGSARKVLEFVTGRMVFHGEPWIVQTYVSETHRLLVSLPDAVEDLRTVDAHARFMVFGAKTDNGPPTVMGGLGNYGPHWKVSGKTPATTPDGTVTGTAFNDLRVEHLSNTSTRSDL